MAASLYLSAYATYEFSYDISELGSNREAAHRRDVNEVGQIWDNYAPFIGAAGGLC